MIQVHFLNTPWIYFMSLDLIIERLKHKHSQPAVSKVHWRNNSVLLKALEGILGDLQGSYVVLHRRAHFTAVPTT